MRRLSIIDLAGGRQPMTNEDGHVVVVFNGEIYNYRIAAGGAPSARSPPRTESDTEVLAHLYEEHGDDFVQRLRGMFAFALWDAARRRLVLGRDRLGIKPLYVVDDGRRLMFASEIKALLRHPAVTPSLDPVAVNQYLALKYVPAPRTMFRGIASVEPGTVLVADGAGVRQRRYWDIPGATAAAPTVGTDPRSGRRWVQELRTVLRESVALHLRSDVPYGAFLSGGLDSSTIVALMSEALPEPVKTYSVGFVTDGVTVGELRHAKVVARHVGSDHHELVMTGTDFTSAAERVVWHLDQPLADVATIPMLLLSDLASRDVKMVLSGEGGDELFGGYARHLGERYAGALGLVPRRLRSAILGAVSRSISSRRWANVLQALSTGDDARRLAAWFPLLGDDLRHELSTVALLAQDSEPSPAVFAATLAAGDGRERDPLGRLLYCDTKLWLPDLLLARADKVTMAASLELRVPLLDHHVVEFAASVPSSLKVHGLSRKWSCCGRSPVTCCPQPCSSGRRRASPCRSASWFRAEARELVRDTLAPAAVGGAACSTAGGVARPGGRARIQARGPRLRPLGPGGPGAVDARLHRPTAGGVPQRRRGEGDPGDDDMRMSDYGLGYVGTVLAACPANRRPRGRRHRPEHDKGRPAQCRTIAGRGAGARRARERGGGRRAPAGHARRRGGCVCPEFLREGSAVADFRDPPRVVIGGLPAVDRPRLLPIDAGHAAQGRLRQRGRPPEQGEWARWSAVDGRAVQRPQAEHVRRLPAAGLRLWWLVPARRTCGHSLSEAARSISTCRC